MLILIIGFSYFTFSLPSKCAREEMPAEEVKTFMKELAQYVEKYHLKKNPASPQMGMVYEYMDTSRIGKTGQWIQGEALDTMHDGAWYAAAIAQAYTATKDEYYLDFLNKYQIPFYTNILNNSDTLFKDGLDGRKSATAKRGTFQRSHKYMGEKGFCPYFWDDGSSVSLERDFRDTGQHPYECVDYYLLDGEQNQYFRLNGFSLGCSNHMAQDLAVMLMQVWLITRNPEVAEAAKNLQASRMLHHGHIPMVDAAAALTNKDAELMAHVPAVINWMPDNHYTRILGSLEQDETLHIPGFADDQEYNYYFTIAKEGGALNRAIAMRTIYDAFTHPMLIRYWSDSQEVPAGMNRFDLASFPAKNGKMVSYRSEQDGPMGSRMGPQNMVVCGWALQALRKYPGIWEERYHQQFPADLLVRFLDEAPEIDGKLDNGYSEQMEIDGVKIRLASDRNNLYLFGQTDVSTAEITLYSQSDSAGAHAILTIREDGTVTAKNNSGELLVHEAKIVSRDEGFIFEIRLPYTIVKQQKKWANGIEHGRYSVRVGESGRNFYLLSTEQPVAKRRGEAVVQVKESLLKELVGGLHTWRRIFKEKGYIPTGIGASKVADTEWDSLSDAGGYAHLIAAASQYLLYLDDKFDWEEEGIPEVK